MKFTNIDLASGVSGARDGHGLKRTRGYYVTGSEYGIGTTANATLNSDYYIVWNAWPVFSGTPAEGTRSFGASTALGKIGITALTTTLKETHVSGTLDCVIVRKSDRKAVRVQVTGTNHEHYETINPSNASTTITAIDPKQGPRTPETGRLTLLGYA